MPQLMFFIEIYFISIIREEAVSQVKAIQVLPTHYSLHRRVNSRDLVFLKQTNLEVKTDTLNLTINNKKHRDKFLPLIQGVRINTNSYKISIQMVKVKIVINSHKMRLSIKLFKS
jgi:hypothetical protein